jgi:serine protease Do
VIPSVVSVYSREVGEPGSGREMPRDPFHFFFGPQMGPDSEEDQEPMVRRSSGSGFFISPSGEVITNNHVVEDADKIEVQLADGTRYQVDVVGRDPATDIALLRVSEPNRDFPYLALGSAERLRVGEWVMAVGNPLNMDHTVTVGVVSAKGRVLGLSDSSFENFIQTDAAINFGNSGGPLVNTAGQVVGINTAINAGGQNIGFAVPVKSAERVIPQLRESGKVVRGYLGAMVRNVTQEAQEAFGLESRKGAFVESVEPKYAAAKAGLQPGDVVVAVDGRPIADTRELIDMVSSKKPGSTVKLEVVRERKRVSIDVVLDERPGNKEGEGEEPAAEGEGSLEKIGVSASELNPRLRQAYGVGDELEGVLITHVDPTSTAAEGGLLTGDVITQANGVRITTVEELRKSVDSLDQVRTAPTSSGLGPIVRFFVLLKPTE